ncbi:unnamed protein product [Xylocopa violacea]|uniref:Uncharacterized protein n=1 Tax=Xylocopa violacea TaxID=135666 RepID=A0ABP1P3D7_XYLVO
MFSRAAKSIVKTIGQRKYHAGEENIKLAMIGGAGEIGRSLSQMLKQGSKLDVLALYDVTALNKRFSTPIQIRNFSNGESNSRMLTMLEKSRSTKANCQSEGLPESYLSNCTSNACQNNTEELVESLRRLPIAEESVANQLEGTKMASQGDNACASEPQGPRVLAEMGPATFRHGGSIVAEIYRQLPDLPSYLNRTRFSGVCAATTRRPYSNLALFSNSINEQLQLEKLVADFIACPERASKKVDKFAVAMRNGCALEKGDRRCHAKKRDFKRLNGIPSEDIAEKKPFKVPEDRFAIAQKADKRKARAKKCNEPKISEETRLAIEARTDKTVRRSYSLGKTKNWSIPAALSDKKPKMLYGLVRQRQRPLTNFFTRFFDAQNDAASENICTSKYRDCKTDRLGGTRNERVSKRSNNEDKAVGNPAIPRGNGISNVSTSTSNLLSELVVETAETSTMDLERSSRSNVQTQDASEPVDQLEIGSESSEERPTTSSNDENDALGEPQDSRTTMSRKVSSKIALFLENLRLARRDQRSRSTSSLASYDLGTLFEEQRVAATVNQVLLGSVRSFSSSDSDSKSTVRNMLRKLCGKKAKKVDDICEKRRTSCKTTKDECKKAKAPDSCGQKKEPVCKKREIVCEKKKVASCGDREKDPCKKFKKADAKPCKVAEDPCKKLRKPEVHAKSCKPEKPKEDPCDKQRKCETRRTRCKTEQKKTEKSCAKDKCKTDRKSECPPVFRAPGCPKDEGKSGGGDSCRKYSTYASRFRTEST